VEKENANGAKNGLGTRAQLRGTIRKLFGRNLQRKPKSKKTHPYYVERFVGRDIRRHVVVKRLRDFP